MDHYDYIIIGAGSAGCVLANRLSADKHRSVLVLEAGRSDRNPLLKMPLACGLFFFNPDYSWGFQSEPEPFADDRRIPAVAGKVLGGGSTINGMIYSRGDPRDYDQWSQMGAAGWSYEDVLPYFKRSEKSWRGAGAFHGEDGPLGVSAMQRDEIHARMIDTARRKGYSLSEDFEGGHVDGFGIADVTVYNGKRSSTSQSYLHPILRRPNITLRTGAAITRIIIETGRAVGVEFIREGRLVKVLASEEVLLCAGVYNSPKILMLSGIGPADALLGHGISTVSDLPGVGKNLQDHATVIMAYQASKPVRLEQHLRLDRLVLGTVRWGLFNSGPVTESPASGYAFIKSRPEVERADLEWTFVGAYTDSKIWFPGWRKSNGGVIAIQNILLRPESRGEVKLRSADPADAPSIRFNVLGTPSDRETLLQSLRMNRDFMASAPMRDMVAAEAAPGEKASTDEELLAYMRQTVFTNLHATSTCAMGVGTSAVVDPTLKVYGIEGLRVVDASVMPTIPGAHTNAPTIMIAEKAADLILGKGPGQRPLVPTLDGVEAG